MTIGIAISPSTPADSNAVDTLIDLTQQAADAGIDSVWFAQLFEHDAITAAAIAGHAVPGIQVGTSVVPIYPRHPITLSSQAQTAQAATHGRFSLGLGLSARDFVQNAYGLPWDRPIKHLREYLRALRSLLDNGEVDLAGETLVAKSLMPAKVPGAQPPVPILVAAMGPQALQATGELADGTLPFLASPKVLTESIVPAITRAAAGRPAPRVVASFVGIVTSSGDEIRAAARERMSMYDQIPSYRKILDQGGVGHASELAVIGSEEAVAAEVQRYFDAGVTEVVVSQLGLASAEDRGRTWALLGELGRS